ncbi:cytochrome P450 [Nemania sp. FL0916]|nr:cytochrome P450 [Nemania sp. FL0916]
MEALLNLVPKGLPLSVQVIGLTIIISIVYAQVTKARPWPAFPLISVHGLGPRKSWLLHAREVMAEGFKKTNGPFQVMTGTGPKIVLPNRYAEEIRNLPELSLPKSFILDFFVNYPGFQPHKKNLTHDWLIKDTVRIKLTQSLGLITEDLTDETTATIDDVFGPSPEWATRLIREDMVEIVARVSSRVFLGTTLCRNRRWLEIAKTFTTDTFALAFIMRMAPALVRPFVYLATPHSARLRKSVRDAYALVTPEVEKRKAAVDAAKAAGEKPPKTADTIGWMYDLAKGEDLDFVSAQLSLTMAAIHTTTEAICRALLDLCKYPDIAQQLRDEVIEVIGREGWARTALYQLRLMDSFLKESQRATPFSLTSMNRYIEKPITLSDGIVLPKGSRVFVAADFANPDLYSEPESFDVARFVKKRAAPGQENSWQFVSTSASYLSFGYGEHACPGRFFAANEIKIILCHLLLKYDWRYVPDEPRPSPRAFEASASVKADTRIQGRRRKAEIDLDAL